MSNDALDRPAYEPIDIPKDPVPLIRRRVEGGTYVDLESDGGVDIRPALKILTEVLAKNNMK